jgi:hypothetical protein
MKYEQESQTEAERMIMSADKKRWGLGTGQNHHEMVIRLMSGIHQEEKDKFFRILKITRRDGK